MNDRKDPEVIDYLNQENNYTSAVLENCGVSKDSLFLEMKARIKEDDTSPPYFKNGYWYYSRYEKGQEHPVHCRKQNSLDNEEEILINENEEAEKFPYYDIVSFAVSKDNNLLAFAEDISGRRMYRIRFKDLRSGQILENLIENAGSDLAWHNNGNQLYYSLKDTETLRPHKIMCHSLEDKSNQLIFEEKDDTYICGVSLNKDFDHLLIGSYSSLTTEFQFKSADDDKPFKIFLKREEKHEYYIELKGTTAIIKTNKGAENYRMMRCELSDSAFDSWQLIQEHSTDIYIEDFEVFKNHYVIQEKENGLTQLRVYNILDHTNKVIPPFEETFMLYIGTNPEMEQDMVRIGYSSMPTPFSTYDIHLNTFDKKLIKQTEVLGDFKSENYQSERVWAKGRDGVSIPISLVYKKELFQKDEHNPVLLYAYGSYGSTVDPYFSSIRLSLLDRGFVFAIAHIRGGEYLGRNWYDTGKLLKKKNTFYDFIDCAEYLIHEKYAEKNSLFAMGGSAGGLLMGAVANLRPDLWAGIVSQVPFVDVLTTMLDDSIPLTTGEYDEWGNPNDKLYYDYMATYSPYDNIEEKAYPPILVTSGLHDSQVQYWEPTKYVAKIRELKTDNKPVLLHTNMDAGHGGSSGRFESIKEIALEYAFILWLNGQTVK
jgi:oligopeptidase B